jgi:hypothetical protein
MTTFCFGYLMKDVQELITKMARLLSEGLEDRGRSPATLTRHVENIFNYFFCKNILSLLLNFYLNKLLRKVFKIRSILAG